MGRPLNETGDWIKMRRTLMYEHGVEEVVSSAEISPEDPGEEATARQKAGYKVLTNIMVRSSLEST